MCDHDQPACDMLLLQRYYGRGGHNSRTPHTAFLGRCKDHSRLSRMQHGEGYILPICAVSKFYSRECGVVPCSCEPQQNCASPAPLFDVSFGVYGARCKRACGLAPIVVQRNVGENAVGRSEAPDTCTYNGKKWHTG